MTTDVKLPEQLPGREADDALGVDDVGLAALRSRICAHLDTTQAVFAARPLWDRLLPLACGVLAAAGVVAWGLLHDGAEMSASTLAGVLGSIVASVAVGLAPQMPGRAEIVARAALAIACGSLAVEMGLAWTSAPVDGATDFKCASTISLLALPPLALSTWFLLRSHLPTRAFHLAALACAGFLASGAAVWAECPGTHVGHVMRSHILAPVVVAALLAVVVGRFTRGRPLPPRV